MWKIKAGNWRDILRQCTQMCHFCYEYFVSHVFFVGDNGTRIKGCAGRLCSAVPAISNVLPYLLHSVHSMSGNVPWILCTNAIAGAVAVAACVIAGCSYCYLSSLLPSGHVIDAAGFVVVAVIVVVVETEVIP